MDQIRPIIHITSSSLKLDKKINEMILINELLPVEQKQFIDDKIIVLNSDFSYFTKINNKNKK